MSHRLSLVLAGCLFMAAPALADRGGYVIKDFHVEVEVRSDADVIVRERLEIDFSQPRHGIYRTIPVRYTDPRGYGYSLGFRLLGVDDEHGMELRTKLSNEGRYVKIRIGDPDFTVRGRVVYVVRYRVRNALGHFAEHDELYWNATGNEWQAPIERASATVRLPGEVKEADLELAGYTGRFGSREQAVRTSLPRGDTVSFVVPRPLVPLEGLTVAVAWPRGLVAFPGAMSRTARFLAENWVLLFPAVALGFLLRAYRRSGRDPEGPGAVVVRYEPPPGMTPGEIGTLVDEKVDLRDVTATVIDLAVRGHLKIEIEKKSRLFGLLDTEQTVFERLDGGSSEDLAPHESRLLGGLFKRGNRVDIDDLKQRFYKHLPGIKDDLYDRLTARGYFAGKPSSIRALCRALGIGAGILATGTGLLWTYYRGGVMPHAAIVPVVAGVVTAALFFGIAPAMPRRTRKGVEMRGWALGFEEFVDRVERDKLEADRARNVFESLLPYAMALGVAAAWARQFEGIYEQAGPTWFVGPDPSSGQSTRAFEQSLTSAMDRAVEVMASSPRSQGSSGSGGGGFSGGGGGGGGGGSW